MLVEKRLQALSLLGAYIKKELKNPSQEWEDMCFKAEFQNPWFTQAFLKLSFQSIVEMLDIDALHDWTAAYEIDDASEKKKIAVIMAGNLPMVGFHDFLSVVVSGNYFIGKLSSKDMLLLPQLANKLVEIEPAFEPYIVFTDELLKEFDAIIATGSNNSARYFESYFGKYPNIIRRNRNSVAIISGKETDEELKAIANDIYYYFGLGCRSVNKIFLPLGYHVPDFIDHMQGFDYLFDHNKFNNNYSYNRSILLLNQIPFLDNGFTIFREEQAYASPISVIHYEFYDDISKLENTIKMDADKIQCVVQANSGDSSRISPGNTQFPQLFDYADNVDVMSFLIELNE